MNDPEEMSPEYLAALQADLDELERTDPTVAAAAARYDRAIESILATRDVCVYCSHPVDHHGTTQVGCRDCSCGYESDWHPDPPRGDE